MCLLLLLAVMAAAGSAQAPSDLGWPTYGGDPGGTRYTPASQISKANVTQLRPAWTFHTGALARGRKGAENSSFEATPVLFRGALYLSSPYDEVFALDPATGAQRWRFDPALHRNLTAGLLTSRGVATWESSGTGPCTARIFIATMDARLIALDAATGARCAGFGAGSTAGEVDLTRGIDTSSGDEYYNTSPPTVVGNVVIVGSGIIDNQRVSTESGVVRGFDVRTGARVWGWDPIPWAAGQQVRTGAANAWSVLAADPEHGLVFVPTGSASPDFYGGLRPGEDRDANSVVALEAATGRRVWAFQTSHHDVWDYDVAAEPLLFTWRGPGGHSATPAVAITTKQGLVFVLNRLTGEPLFPVEERAVPQTDVAGEHTSATQPFQVVSTGGEPLAVSPLTLDPNAMLGGSAQDNADCRKLLATARYDGIYTPPSLRGSLEFPGNLGGVNWGGAAFDPVSGILYANTNRYGFVVTLSPRASRYGTALAYVFSHQQYDVAAVTPAVVLVLLVLAAVRRRRAFVVAALVAGVAGAGLLLVVRTNAKRGYKAMQVTRVAEHFGVEFGPQLQTPYTVVRKPLTAPKSHVPCTTMPWGTVSAINLNTGQRVFETPLGTRVAGQHSGTVNLGGDVVTGGGLVFTAASEEAYLRAFDAGSGAELWRGALPVPAQSTPMSYTWQGRQYVVIAAGGHGLFGTPVGDSLIAFAVPQ